MAFRDFSGSDLTSAIQDLEFRKQWDSGTTNLQVIDALPEGSPAIIWWRFGLPLPLFNDRDFVFARHSKRFDHGAWVVWDKTVEHAKAPPVKNVVRVTNYHRYLVYRPHSEPQNMELVRFCFHSLYKITRSILMIVVQR